MQVKGKILSIIFCLLTGCAGEDPDTVIQIVNELNEIQRCEIPEQTHQKNPYTHQGCYSIALCEGIIEVTLRLELIGEAATDEYKEKCKGIIEEVWSTDRFEVPIQIVVIWTDKDPDKRINVNKYGNRWNTSEWYQINLRAAAHEAGHYLGLFDEYGGGDAQGFDGGAAPGPREPHESGLMCNSKMKTLDYYYDHFLLWYYCNV
jgi:hypothetical protein